MKNNHNYEILITFQRMIIYKGTKDLIVRKVNEWKYNYLHCIALKKQTNLKSSMTFLCHKANL